MSAWDTGASAGEARPRCTNSLRVNPSRSRREDLWPCVWFLASILERQFFGTIFIDADLASPPSSPADLGPRCLFVKRGFAHEGLVVGIGATVEGNDTIWGDARGSYVAYQSFVNGDQCASPVSCCTLAGYLGFSALAHAVGIPSFHQVWTQKSLALPLINLAASIPPQIGVSPSS